MTLKVFAMAGLILIQVPGFGVAEEPSPDVEKARAAVAGLGESLKQQLLAAMGAGGPVAGI